MKAVLFSDLHLDAPFVGMGSRDVAGKRRQALRETLVNIASLVRSEEADALLCGGDLYEHESFTEDTVNFVARVFAELAPVRVFIAPGNHDHYTPGSLHQRAQWSPNVRVFTEARLTPVDFAPGITLWGAAHTGPAGTPGFLDGFRTEGGGIHLALFHGSESGWFMDQGEGKVQHAPFNESQIAASGLHHAFLGHYHRPKAGTRHTYPGNPCPLRFGEEGMRGAVVVEVTPDGTVTQEWRDVAAYRVHERRIDVSGAGDGQQVRERVAAAFAGLTGSGRAIVLGEVTKEVELDRQSLATAAPGLDSLTIDLSGVSVAYDFEFLKRQPTVAGQFVRDVLGDPSMNHDLRRRVLITGLRALDGRRDLEVL